MQVRWDSPNFYLWQSLSHKSCSRLSYNNCGIGIYILLIKPGIFCENGIGVYILLIKPGNFCEN